MASLTKLKAKAKVAVRRRRQKEQDLVDRIAKLVPRPQDGLDGVNGRDGRDAPTMEEILSEIIPQLPTPQNTTIVEEVVQELDEKKLRRLIQEEMPESKLPEIRVIEKEVDFDKGEFITKDEMEDILRRVDQAIQNTRGGGGAGVVALDQFQLANIIVADEATNIIEESDLNKRKINIIHATVQDSTVQLPAANPEYIVWVEDAVLGGGGNITITRASS